MSGASGVPLGTLMSSDTGVGDDQANPASSSAAHTVQPVALRPPPQMVVVALDATRDHREDEITTALEGLVGRGDILRGGDSLLVLAVLSTITHPLGYQTKACVDCFCCLSGRYLSDQVVKIAEVYRNKLCKYAQKLCRFGISVTLKVSIGSPARVVIVQEVNSSSAAWVVLDRHFRRDFRHLKKSIACKVAAFQDQLQVKPLKLISTYPSSKSRAEVKDLQRYAVILDLSSRTLDSDIQVSIESAPGSCLSNHEIHEVDISSTPYLTPSTSGFSLTIDDGEPLFNGKNIEENRTSLYYSPKRSVLCSVCGLKSAICIKNSIKFSFSEIQAATSDFSNENLLGGGEFGHLYKGQLKDGQVIAASRCKNASSQGYAEFFSEVEVHSFARHRNIIGLLGYCYEESYNILVYEYICNNTLEWHLFDKSASLLEWHQRHFIALGIAKAMRFLHEECCASPIIHTDLRPSNVLLTHDFVPMLGGLSLAKWNAGSGPIKIKTRIQKQSGYLAPEYAEYGLASVQTDVFAFGILLFQLISGRKVLDDHGGDCSHILQWAEPLVESLALDELIDDRIKDTYDTCGLYHLANVAYLCVRRDPEQRLSMREVVHLIELENERVRDLSRKFILQLTM